MPAPLVRTGVVVVLAALAPLAACNALKTPDLQVVKVPPGAGTDGPAPASLPVISGWASAYDSAKGHAALCATTPRAPGAALADVRAALVEYAASTHGTGKFVFRFSTSASAPADPAASDVKNVAIDVECTADHAAVVVAGQRVELDWFDALVEPSIDKAHRRTRFFGLSLATGDSVLFDVDATPGSLSSYLVATNLKQYLPAAIGPIEGGYASASFHVWVWDKAAAPRTALYLNAPGGTLLTPSDPDWVGVARFTLP